jgi:hypothetical protein
MPTNGYRLDLNAFAQKTEEDENGTNQEYEDD